jgi:predicted nucleic-acid-binding protein
VIGLDTNVLVRHLVQDEKRQARLASDCIRSRCTGESPCFLSHIVLCELVWVLERAYGYGRPLIADALERILRTGQFRVEKADLAWKALRAYRTTGVDYSDCLVATTNAAAGCTETVTLDRKAARLDGLRLLE